MAKLKQRIEGATVGIAGDWNAMGLEGFCLAEVQVGKQQLMPLRTPESPLRQQHKLLRAPLPDELSHQ